jgi:hypothetical protein
VTTPDQTTLLALLLALNTLETRLSLAEQENLKTVGKQLEANPKAWKITEKRLLKGIEANPSLNQRYQTAKAQLDALDGNIPSELLPTLTELEQILPTGISREKFPWFEGEPDTKSQEFLNLSVKVLTNPDPVNTTKKLSRLEKIWQFLNKPIT